MRWNDVMMPHTVPNNPMNGVMLAVVASSGSRRSSFGDLDGRGAQQRAVDGRQALQGRTCRRAPPDCPISCAACFSWVFSSA